MSALPFTSEERRPFDVSLTLPNIELMRDAVATMAICGEGFDQVLRMIEAKRTSSASAIDEEFQHRTFDLRRQITAIDELLRKIEKTIEEAKNNQVLAADLQQKKLSLQREIDVIQQEIKKKKTAAERRMFKLLLDTTNDRVRSAATRLTEEEKTALNKQHESWQRQLEEFERRAKAFEQHVVELDERLKEAQERAKPLIERNITRTVAGFLLWVGYGSFAAIGSTIALLLPPINNQKAPLAQILGAVRSAVAGFPSSWSIAWVFVVSLMFFFVGVVLFGGFVWGLDRLLQRFDNEWRREARRKPRGNTKGSPGNQALDAQLSATIPEVRRSSYVQMIAALPYVVITGAITCLLAASSHTLTAGTPAEQANAVPESIVATYIGTVLALLMTSSFVMYVLKILDRRSEAVSGLTERRASWKTGWEFFVLPFVVVGALIYATAQTKLEQAWGPIAIFMLLSCLATAYGVVYRGIFYDIVRLERERDKYLRAIGEARSVTEPDLEETFAITEAREELRRAKEDRDRIDVLQYPGLVNEHGPFLHRVFGRRPAPPKVPFDLDLTFVTEEEAAKNETERIRALNAEASDTEQTLVRVSASLIGVEIPLLVGQKADVETKRLQAEADRDALEFQRHRATWELNSQIENMTIDLRAAYDIAKKVEPAVTRMSTGVPNQ
jgi:hypothetical protein